MEAREATAPSASSPTPPQEDSVFTFPSNVEFLLHAVRILLGYGRHLIDTARHRSAAPNFNAIAACFGTDNLSTILAHLNRGVLRCLALERILLARAAAGRDIDFVERRPGMPEQPPSAAGQKAAQPAPAAVTTRKRASRPSRPAGWNDPELFMPTLEDLEHQMRRRPIGRIVYDICLDLAVVPGFCHSAFWNELFDIMNWFGGGTSVARLMQEKTNRRRAFANEQDRRRDSNWDWVNMSRDGPRKVLGFFIGEPPVNPFDRAAVPP